MSIHYISPKALSSKVNAGFYLTKPYQAGLYNFKMSVKSDHAAAHSTKKVAEKILEKQAPPKRLSFGKKAVHFLKHIGVGIALCIPIVNSFIFVDMVLRAKKNWVPPKNEEPVKSAAPQQNKKPTPKPAAPKKTFVSGVEQPQSPSVKDRVKNKEAEQRKNETPETVVLDGKRAKEISLKKLNEDEKNVSILFFHLFPDAGDKETVGLRKKKEEFKPLSDADKQIIQGLFIKSPGAREVKLASIQSNLDLLNEYIQGKKESNEESDFYILFDFKQDIQSRPDHLPHNILINAIFALDPESFAKKLKTFQFEKERGYVTNRTPMKVTLKAAQVN